MLKRLLMLAAALFVAVACSGDDATTTTSAAQSAPTRTAAAEPVPAASDFVPPPPPVSFSVVEADYTAAVSAILSDGRLTVDQLLAEDFEALYARLDAAMSGSLSVEDLGAGRDELQSQAPLGDRIADRAIQLSPSLRVYGAQVEWGDEALSVTVSFDAASQITALFLTPQLPLPDDPAGSYESAVDFRLPFEGLWFVFWGGDSEIDNYHVAARDQRHALDLVVWKDGGTHRGDGTANEDYWAYGQNVIAPAAGTVVTVVDGIAENIPQVGSDPANPAGNHVVIQVAEGEYVLLAHMRPGSVTVAEGDAVESGQQIGLVGNSGNSTEPHIHIHLQDQPAFDSNATGLPLEFSSYLADGEAMEKGQPVADQFVAAR